MRAISSVRLERSAHNADELIRPQSIRICRGPLTTPHLSSGAGSTQFISMRNRVVRSSNLRWPTWGERDSVRVPALLSPTSYSWRCTSPSSIKSWSGLSSGNHEVEVPASWLLQEAPLTGHIAQLGQSAGLLTPEVVRDDIPTELSPMSSSSVTSGGSKPDVVSSNLTVSVYGIGDKIVWQSKT